MNWLFLFLLPLLLGLTGGAQEPAPTAITGRWQPADKRGVLEIYAAQGHFYGKVVGPTTPPRLDTENPNPKLRQRALLGTVILQGFRFDGKGTWQGGTIYDPTNGKTYAATLRLRDANTLVVRGYVGIPLFGRTVVWSRLP
ncbi:DUF2147 domain-containing protein [Hymenobacter sp. BT770]|uniref:DUF2147 domain-containing protein n=1 Tax=Hymenobacter sp. BT770 TaxID=2886942 RepID=UPI001D0F8863|nr:DUF2147 domain-containing protein [Hymenobacter sp. BT770]MCC3153576.1 DUF2147 domain-containing protein [Hymenobacter sp. BT770]MDO3415812.1 DUF2147 domain-containing protein [Hymenobacter sp. BT770]